MAARRRSSSSSARTGRSRASSATASRSSGARSDSGPKIGPDGRASIACPRCNTNYKVPEQHLDSVVTCKNCKTAFTPRRANSGARATRRAGSGGAGPMLLRIGLIASPFVIGLIILMMTQKEKPPAKVEVADDTVYLGSEHAPYQRALAFCKGVAKKENFAIERVLSWPHVWAKSSGKNPNGWNNLSAEDKKAFQDKTFADIYASELGTVFDTHDVTTTELVPVEFPHDAKAMTVTLKFPFKEDRNIGMAVVEHDVQDGDGGWLVHDWKLLSFYKDRRPQLPTREKHKTLKKPKYEEVTIKGQKVKANMGEEVPMDHLESTPPELRKKIDDLIAQVFTQSDSPKAGIMAAQDLQMIGKPAIPRILNALYERPIKTQFEREGAGMMVKTYNLMVGTGVPWFFDDDPTSVFGGTDEDRRKLIRMLFGNWWLHYHKEEGNFQGESDEDLDAAMKAGAEAIDTNRRGVQKAMPPVPKKDDATKEGAAGK
ncbi:MAG: hypothetical protein H6832_09710 [Planctomycetes bacterium]|nr:hypothetical protein [Planctomycetota bacterium]MCB9918666.1 hypothetical protein [Planctomycetota bacterium]